MTFKESKRLFVWISKKNNMRTNSRRIRRGKKKIRRTADDIQRDWTSLCLNMREEELLTTRFLDTTNSLCLGAENKKLNESRCLHAKTISNIIATVMYVYVYTYIEEWTNMTTKEWKANIFDKIFTRRIYCSRDVSAWPKDYTSIAVDQQFSPFGSGQYWRQKMFPRASRKAIV